MTNFTKIFKRKNHKKVTPKKQKSDNTAQFSERIIVRVEPELKKKLYQEMKEKNITKISTYIRLILAKRNQKNTKNSTISADENNKIGQKEYIKITYLYNELLQKIKEISVLKDAENKPVFNQKELYEKIKILNENTIEMARLLKKFVNDNPNSK